MYKKALKILILADSFGQGRNNFKKWSEHSHDLSYSVELEHKVQTKNEIIQDPRFNDLLLSSKNYANFVKLDSGEFLEQFTKLKELLKVNEDNLKLKEQLEHSALTLEQAEFFVLNNPYFIDLTYICQNFDFLIVLCNEEGIEKRGFSPLLVSLLSSDQAPAFALFNLKIEPNLLDCVISNFSYLNELKNLVAKEQDHNYKLSNQILERFSYDLNQIYKAKSKQEKNTQDIGLNPKERLISRKSIYTLNYYALNIFAKAKLIISEQVNLDKYLKYCNFNGLLINHCPVSLCLNPTQSLNSCVNSFKLAVSEEHTNLINDGEQNLTLKQEQTKEAKEIKHIVLSLDFEQVPQIITPYSYFEQLAFVLDKVKTKYPHAKITLLLTKSLYICLDQIHDFDLKLTQEDDFFNAFANSYFVKQIQDKIEFTLKTVSLIRKLSQSKNSNKLNAQEFIKIYDGLVDCDFNQEESCFNQSCVDFKSEQFNSTNCDVFISNNENDLNCFRMLGCATFKFSLASSIGFNIYLNTKNLLQELTKLFELEQINFGLMQDNLKVVLDNPIALMHLDCIVLQIEHLLDLQSELSLKQLEQKVASSNPNISNESSYVIEDFKGFFNFDESEALLIEPSNLPKLYSLQAQLKDNLSLGFNLQYFMPLVLKAHSVFSTLSYVLNQIKQEQELVQSQTTKDLTSLKQEPRVCSCNSIRIEALAQSQQGQSKEIEVNQVNELEDNQVKVNDLSEQSQEKLNKSLEQNLSQLSNYTQTNRYEPIFEQLLYLVKKNQADHCSQDLVTYELSELANNQVLSKALSPYQDSFNNLSFLSFGCSNGIEVFELISLFDGIKITGVDIDPQVIEYAKQSIQKIAELTSGAQVIFSEDGYLELSYLSHKAQVRFMDLEYFIKDNQEHFDVISCMTVLCNHPEDNHWLNSLEHYPFTKFQASVELLDRHLKEGGILCLYNSNYLLLESEVGYKYQALYPCVDLFKQIQTDPEQIQDFSCSMQELALEIKNSKHTTQKTAVNKKPNDIGQAVNQDLFEMDLDFSFNNEFYPLALTNYVHNINAISLDLDNLGFGFIPVFDKDGNKVEITKRASIFIKK